MKRPILSTNGHHSSSAGKNADGSPAPDAIRAQLEKVLASEGFVHAERLSRFLKFSVEQAIHGHADELKEYVLGLAVFDREESYDPRIDPIVRVEAGRLRSKLREYYATQGRDDPILIDFPKGSYAPSFQMRASQEPVWSLGSRIRTLHKRIRFWLLALALIMATGAYVVGSLTIQNRALQRKLEATQYQILDEEARPVWGRFFAPDTEIFVVFGSPIFFSGPEGSGLFLRLASLNETANLIDDPNLQMLKKRFGPLSGPRYDYALMGDAIALQRLTAYLCKINQRLTALPAHLARWEVIGEGNIVILGTPRMLPLLNKLPVHRDFVWDANHNIVNRNPQPSESATYVTPSHWDKISYALIGHFPGLQPDREILSLTAHSAPGILAAVDYVTRRESLRAMNERLQLTKGGDRKPYEMLLRIFVDSGTPIKSEYVTHHFVSSQPRVEP